MTDEDDLIEELIQRCLRDMRSDGEAGLKRVCSEHPEHAERLRSAVRSLALVQDKPRVL